MPTSPNGRNALAPAASVGLMSKRLAGSKSGIMPTTKATSATTAMIVMPNMSLSASPTP